MALIDAKYAEVGTELTVDVRGRRVAVKIVPLPFYTRGK
jgi:aminomethyltransferase